jgi:sodium transport system permease protein
MNLNNVKLILRREIRDQLRDRRTLFMIFVLPVLLYPLLGMSLFQVSQFRRAQPTSVLVLGAPKLNSPPYLINGQGFERQLFSDPEREADLLVLDFAPQGPEQQADLPGERAEACRAVEAGKYDAALYFPPDFAPRLESFRRLIEQGAPRAPHSPPSRAAAETPAPQVPSPQIIYTTANERSQIARGRLWEVLRRWTEAVGKSNLAAGGVPAEAAQPFEAKTKDVAEDTAYHGAALWSKILPVMLLLWAMTGAFYPAVDLCAGEKERGTLETLLSSPAERSEIVLGKLLTIMGFSMATAVLNLVSMGAAGWLIFGRLPDFGPPPPLAPLWLAIALVPVSALYSALCLALAAFARSTREGQYYLVPLMLVTMPLAVLPMTPGVELTLGSSLIPVTGVVLLLRNMLEGSYWPALQYLPLVLGVTLTACFLAVRWAVEQFNSEAVLFRASEQFDVRLWLRHLLRDRQATPTVAMAVCCGVLILLICFLLEGVANPDRSFASFARVTMVLQLAAIATPAILMAVLLTSRPRQTLLLVLPRWPAIPAALALAVALHPVASALQTAVRRLYPVSDEMQKALQGIEEKIVHAPFWQLLLILAVAPAICEELAFRGFILSGFRHLGHRGRAVVYAAIFFGLTHGILQQSLIACLLGIVLGLLAVQTGSLLPGVLFHLVHNTLAIGTTRLPELLERWPRLEKLARQWPALHGWASTGPDGISYHWPAVVSGGLLAALILAWFVWLRAPKSPEEALQEAIDHGGVSKSPLPLGEGQGEGREVIT